MYDILEENVTAVENIEKQRQPYQTLEAIYFLTPCKESCYRLVDDFSRKDGPMYSAAHVHFINGLDNDVFATLNKKLEAEKASNYIKSLKEIYVDFTVKESLVFSLDEKHKFRALFGSSSSTSHQAYTSNQIEPDIEDMAKKLLCVCATLGENPLVRYHRPLDAPGAINRNIPFHLAKAVQNELDNFCKVNPEFPPAREYPMPRGTLIILDRTIDPISPFLHEFTYQAMFADLLDVEDTSSGLKYSYTAKQDDGTTKDQEVTLNEQDTLYTTIRHFHIADANEHLAKNFSEFVAERTDSPRSLHEMKQIISKLPQFQEMKSKYSAHISVASDCMSVFNDQGIEKVGLLEQNMACGQTPEGHSLKDLVDQLIPVLDDPYTDNLIKTRLILLWIATSDNVNLDERELLLSHARLDSSNKNAIENIKLLGVQLSKSANRQGEKMKRNRKKKRESIINGDDVPLDLSRYVPVVKRVVDGHIKESIDNSLFPYLRTAEPQDLRRDSTSTRKQTPQLRVYRTQWHKKSIGKNAVSKPPSGPPVIIFVVGGITYSEIRSAYELAEIHDREVYIGSTHVIVPDEFVSELSVLNKDIPQPVDAVPPYTTSVHTNSPKKTSSTTPVPSHQLGFLKRRS